MEQALRDGIIDRNPARVNGWQREYQLAQDELNDPRSLALPDWETLVRLAAELVARSFGNFSGWGDVVIFAASTAARIGEVSGVRAGDVDTESWIWTVRRQTTPGPGGLIDKGTKGKRAREVPLIEEIRPLVEARVKAAMSPDARLFTGPKGGRISTAVLRDAAAHRPDLLADAGVPVHVLRKIAGHGSITTTQRYLHPDRRSLDEAAASLSAHLSARRSPGGPHLRAVQTDISQQGSMGNAC